jgi:hypothetical protein
MSYDFIKSAKQKLPIFIPNGVDTPVIGHKTLLTFLSDVILGNFVKDKENDIVFEITHSNEEKLKDCVRKINSDFYAHVLSELDSFITTNSNSNTIQMNDVESNNSNINISVNQGLYFNKKDDQTVGMLTQKYENHKQKLLNEIKSIFADKTVNELTQHLDNNVKRGLITQLASALGLESNTEKLGQAVKSKTDAINLLEKIYEQLDVTTSNESYKQKFITNYKSKLDQMNKILIDKYNATGSNLQLNVNQYFDIFHNKISKENIVHSIYSDINSSKLFNVSEKTLNIIKETSEQHTKNVTKDEGLFDFIGPFFVLCLLGGVGFFTFFSMKNKRFIGGNDNDLIELDLPSMLPNIYFVNETDKNQNIEQLIQLRRFLLANGKPHPNENLTKLFYELKKENYITNNPTSIYVTREFVEKNFDNQSFEIDFLLNKKKKIRFNEQAEVSKEKQPIVLNKNEEKQMIGAARGNFCESKKVDEALYNDFL